MYVCRLFARDRPFEQVEARFLDTGALVIGRDPAHADWVLPDPDGTLSRVHCVLSVAEGRLMLEDRSTNGVFLPDGKRVSGDHPVELAAGSSIALGALSILIEEPEAAALAPEATGGGGGAGGLELTRVRTPVAADWADAAPSPRAPHRDASLMEAFCEGAGLDASALSAEDPGEVMRRAGAVYRQTVLGLSALMADRARTKADHQLHRTAIGARDNNPFKWTPSRRVAQDLLMGRGGGFLSDAEAVRASFEDLGRHLAGVAAGADAATALAVERLSPESVDAEARREASLLRRGPAVAWEVLNRRFRELTEGGALRRAFGEAYGRADAAERS